MSKKETLSFVYTKVDDNLISAVDGSNIYGLGYRYKSLAFRQYVSDYRDFNVFVNLRYIKQFSTEVPIDNKDIEVSNIALNVSYRF